MGSSPIIIHIESAAGIKEGGRTGLVGVIVGGLFAVSTFFAPLFGKIPPCATAPVLILVGTMMMSEATNIDWREFDQALPAFLTLVMMPFTFSIPNGLIFGLASSLVLFVTSGKFIVVGRGLVDKWRLRRAADQLSGLDGSIDGLKLHGDDGSSPDSSQHSLSATTPMAFLETLTEASEDTLSSSITIKNPPYMEQLNLPLGRETVEETLLPTGLRQRAMMRSLSDARSRQMTM